MLFEYLYSIKDFLYKISNILIYYDCKYIEEKYFFNLKIKKVRKMFILLRVFKDIL